MLSFQAEEGGGTHRSPSRNSQQSTISSLSTVSTPVTSNSNKTPTPSRRGSGENSRDATPTQSRQASVRSRSRRSSNGSGGQTPTPRNSGHVDVGELAESNGSLVHVNGEDGETKHKVNGNTSPLKSKQLAADGSNNNDIDSIPCVWWHIVGVYVLNNDIDSIPCVRVVLV